MTGSTVPYIAARLVPPHGGSCLDRGSYLYLPQPPIDRGINTPFFSFEEGRLPRLIGLTGPVLCCSWTWPAVAGRGRSERAQKTSGTITGNEVRYR